jgi:hypothetical protein
MHILGGIYQETKLKEAEKGIAKESKWEISAQNASARCVSAAKERTASPLPSLLSVGQQLAEEVRDDLIMKSEEEVSTK